MFGECFDIMLQKFVLFSQNLACHHIYVSISCRRLGCRALMFFKEPLLNGTYAHTH